MHRNTESRNDVCKRTSCKAVEADTCLQRLMWCSLLSVPQPILFSPVICGGGSLEANGILVLPQLSQNLSFHISLHVEVTCLKRTGSPCTTEAGLSCQPTNKKLIALLNRELPYVILTEVHLIRISIFPFAESIRYVTVDTSLTIAFCIN